MGKKKANKIQDRNRFYNFLRYYVDFVLKRSYSKVLVAGRENLPKDGAIIYAPNHTNALMDALVVLALDRKPKVFVARADIFRNRKLAKIFTFLKIMPIMRLRDGFNEVKKNQQTIVKAVDVLKDKIPFCIFPEGTHQTKYSSLPLSKGIFRIAFQAQEMMPGMPLYIVPLGLRYGNFLSYRSTLRVQIGEPINVGEYIAANADATQQVQMNSMRSILAERMHAVNFYIPNDDDYDAVYEICNAAQPFEVEIMLNKRDCRKKYSLDLQAEANKYTLKRIAALKENNTAKAEKLLELANEAHALREKKGIEHEAVSCRCSAISCIVKCLLLPYAVCASFFALPVNLICGKLFTMLKDPAFKNSARFLVNLLVWPLLMIIYSIVAYCLLPWQWAFPVTLLLLPAPFVGHDVWNAVRLLSSRIKLRSENRLKQLYAQILDILFRE